MHDAILVGVQTAINDDPQLNSEPNNVPVPPVLISGKLDIYRIATSPTISLGLSSSILTFDSHLLPS